MLSTEQIRHRERKLPEIERAANKRPPTEAERKARRRAFLKQRREHRVVAKGGVERVLYVIDGGRA